MNKLSQRVQHELDRKENGFVSISRTKAKDWKLMAVDLEARPLKPTARPATDVKVHWSDGGISFSCPCGEEITTDPEDDPRTCGCGRVYRVSHYVTVMAKET